MWVVATALNKESGYLCHCRNLCRTALEGGRECRENGYSCWLFGRFGVGQIRRCLLVISFFSVEKEVMSSTESMKGEGMLQV